jgi:hypothetical protein
MRHRWHTFGTAPHGSAITMISNVERSHCFFEPSRRRSNPMRDQIKEWRRCQRKKQTFSLFFTLVTAP